MASPQPHKTPDLEEAERKHKTELHGEIIEYLYTLLAFLRKRYEKECSTRSHHREHWRYGDTQLSEAEKAWASGKARFGDRMWKLDRERGPTSAQSLLIAYDLVLKTLHRTVGEVWNTCDDPREAVEMYMQSYHRLMAVPQLP